MSKSYSIALDIGTNSVGYAAVDENGRLLRYHKRPMYGSVIFDQAEPAKERRESRSARRRLARKRNRTRELQDLVFADMEKIDPDFFHRMDESFLLPEDCQYDKLYLKLPKALFADGSVSVGSYGADAPTIYHIRKALAESDKQADLRYVYLAMHHIIKYRGNFLMEGQQMVQLNAEEEMEQLLENLSDPDEFPCRFHTEDGTAKAICDALKHQSRSKSDRADEIIELLHPGKETASKNAAKALANLLVGNVGSLKALLNYEETEPDEKLSFAKPDFNEETYLAVMSDDQAEVFRQMAQLYRWQLFADMLKHNGTISGMMVERYEKHGRDLQELKRWVRAYAPDQFDPLFRKDDNSKGYAAYTDHLRKPKKIKGNNLSRCAQEDFYKALKSVLESNKTAEAVKAAQPLLDAMKEPNGFLPLQRINLNGQIPNQIQAAELEKIIEHQGQFYPTLRENKDKILSLCTFRLPYYVGPLNTNSPFQQWLVRDETQKVHPWNFFEVVDQTATAMGFIQHLTNHCTYLPAEDVLPLHSLLYEEYLVLDELNRVQVKGKLINDAALKKRIMDELFATHKSVSKKEFAKWLRQNTTYEDVTENDITGTHEERKFTANLRTRFDLQTHGFVIHEHTMAMLEELVRWSTVFEDRSILEKLIKQKYPQMTQEQLNFLKRKRYTGWGRLSRKLLDGIEGDYHGAHTTVIAVMRETNDHLMQVLHSKEYHFQERIEEINRKECSGDIGYEEVAGLPCSPALHRSIWTAVRIVRELAEHMHTHGDYQLCSIFLENTREETAEDQRKRTTSRLHQVEKAYANLASSSQDVGADCRAALKECQSEKHLDDRQYLYFMQLGKSLYSGKPLDFENLAATTQIDHILPQCYIKDDSIENRALVLSGENQRKADSLVLDDSIRQSQCSWWRYLHKQGLIGDKKLKSLRRDTVADEDKEKFIARQLVETSQMIQRVTDLFKAHYPDVRVRGIKAGLSSSLREQYSLYKIRELNNLHHGYDAFLAATIGTFVYNHMRWLDTEPSDQIRLQKIKEMYGGSFNGRFEHGMILAAFNRDQVDSETGEILRRKEDHIRYLKAVLGYHDGHVVYLKREKTGKLFDITRCRAGSSGAKIRLKGKLDTAKYGGFGSEKPAYIAAISYQKGKKRAAELVNVPIYLAKAVEENPQVLQEFLEKKYSQVQIIRPKILINQRVEYEGSELMLGSCTEIYNARELFLPMNYHALLYKISKTPWKLTLDDESQMDALIDLLFEKLRKQYPIFGGPLKTLEGKKEDILALPLSQKAKFIMETMKITKAGKDYAQYQIAVPELGIPYKGRLNSKLPNPQHLILIDQSITGLYEKRTKLWPDSEQL